MRKICIVTGSRAEWGLLRRIAELIKGNLDMQLQIIATNMHLSPEFGLTYREIETDGFHIDRRVEMLLSGDTPNATTKSIGLATIGFADAFEELKPDLLVVLGDRYEILAAVSAALIYKIPVAHLHGGEITEGAYDDAIRHAITKMSHLHFTSTEQYRNRVIQMGEQPDRVYNVGAMGVDNIKNIALFNKEQLEESIGGFRVNRDTILITFHPVTMESGTAKEQMGELLGALDSIPDLRVIFTMPNSDTDGRVLIEMIKQWCEANHNRAVWFTSLGLKRYLSALKYVGAVVGNSSSGIVEVPSFGIPTINIGDRQKGRLRAKSVLDCKPTKSEIVEKILYAVKQNHTFAENPYEGSATAQQIVKIIAEVDLLKLIYKKFNDKL